MRECLLSPSRSGETPEVYICRVKVEDKPPLWTSEGGHGEVKRLTSPRRVGRLEGATSSTTETVRVVLAHVTPSRGHPDPRGKEGAVKHKIVGIRSTTVFHAHDPSHPIVTSGAGSIPSPTLFVGHSAPGLLRV